MILNGNLQCEENICMRFSMWLQYNWIELNFFCAVHITPLKPWSFQKNVNLSQHMQIRLKITKTTLPPQNNIKKCILIRKLQLIQLTNSHNYREKQFSGKSSDFFLPFGANPCWVSSRPVTSQFYVPAMIRLALSLPIKMQFSAIHDTSLSAEVLVFKFWSLPSKPWIHTWS